jgi:PAS domain S-box-containing protein
MPISKATLERLVEASPDIVVATDADGKIAYFNDGAEEALGYSREEIVGCDVTEVYPSREEAKAVKRAMRATGRVVSFESRFVAKDGREIPVAISGIIRYDARGHEEGTIGFAKDLSEIIRKDQLAVLGEIAVGLSHEINNPLQMIYNKLSLLETYVVTRPRSEEQVAEQARILSIRSEVAKIGELVQRLSEMAKHEEYTNTRYLGEMRMIDLKGWSSPAARPLMGRRILVVDDDPGVCESCGEILEAAGSEVVMAASGREALVKLEAEAFDLVLSDVVMPDTDGYELFQAVRERFPRTPVALMTAFYHDERHILKRSRLEGLEGVLFKKPVDPDRLLETLAGLLTPLPRAPS